MTWNNSIKQRSKSLEEKFWEKVDIKSKDECWKWKASHNKKGYGNFYISIGHSKDKHCLAHRMAYMLYNNVEIPENMQVCHKCDNPPCVNPSHLFLGTNQDNALDSLRKGRFKDSRGEKHGMSKLTTEEIIEIRRLKKEGFTLDQLGKIYGVHYSTIGYIVKGKLWKHIKEGL